MQFLIWKGSMKIFTKIILTSIVLGTSTLHAADFGVGVKGGTLGYGADFSVTLNESINARVSLTTLSIDSESETVTFGDTSNAGSVIAKADIDYGSSALLFDWHVFDGTFHLTAGLVKADIAVNLKGSLSNDFIINGKAVNVNDIDGELITANVTLSDSYKPYLGLGWGRKAAADSGFSFSAELGVAYLDPSVDLNATVSLGAGISQSELDARLNEAAQSAKNDLADLNVFPVVSIGVNYAF
jgi:hypothetical protein